MNNDPWAGRRGAWLKLALIGAGVVLGYALMPLLIYLAGLLVLALR